MHGLLHRGQRQNPALMAHILSLRTGECRLTAFSHVPGDRINPSGPYKCRCGRGSAGTPPAPTRPTTKSTSHGPQTVAAHGGVLARGLLPRSADRNRPTRLRFCRPQRGSAGAPLAPTRPATVSTSHGPNTVAACRGVSAFALPPRGRRQNLSLRAMELSLRTGECRCTACSHVASDSF